MAKQSEVIEPRTHVSRSSYQSWIRKIGNHTYRFKVMSRSDGAWSVQVDVSQGLWKKGDNWKTVHLWGDKVQCVKNPRGEDFRVFRTEKKSA